MKAARILEPRGPVVIAEVPIPTPGPDEVLLQTEACGLCHSDLFIRSLPSLPHAPVTLGHEAIATIEQLGPDVEGFRKGDRVGLTYLYGGCGSCESCEESRPELCPRQLNTGYHVDGAFAEFVVARAASIVKAPLDLPASHLAPPLLRRLDSLSRGCRHRPRTWLLAGYLRHRRTRSLGHSVRQAARTARRSG